MTNNDDDIERNKLIKEYINQLTGDEKITRLRELRESGLLTNDVLKIYVGIE